ncbi:copper resistance CopC/CopD family protein [Streptomyces candidus]|uniref:Copper transport protein n=1 Tax=Streptomyces candidus TaxID=67283 RepID=A0A7X0LQ48_9ACTN|nr:copper resistance protein CopC [Streptomyces candidus]MBB6437233.1 copper transport protein [Streptomyces candidus]GHH38315.1 transport integral membrane protein [Streptomyces candidus]
MTDTAPHLGTPRVQASGSEASRCGTPRSGTPAATTVVRLLLTVAALFGALLAGASPAAAHAALTDSNPKDGAVLATAPKDVTLNFSEQIALGEDAIRVLDPSGKRADTGETLDLCSGNVVKYGIALRSGLPDGTYTVAWQAVSADSHPISGAFTFSIGAPSESSVALPSQEAGGGAVGVLYDIARYAAYAGFIVLVGGAAFLLACWQRGAAERPMQRLVVRGWLLLTAATLATLLLRAPYTGSGELSGIFDLAALKAVLSTKTGAALVSRLLLLGAAALFVAVLFGAYAKKNAEQADGGGAEDDEDSSLKDLTFGLVLGGGVVAAGIAATWAMSEHASTGLQPGIAMPVDVLHMLAAAAWLGGLAALLVALHRSPALDRAAVRKFSRLAFGSVAVLAATGTYQSWRQVGTWRALVDTTYGQLLLAKIALVVVMVGAAWYSRRWTGRLTEGSAEEPVAAVSRPRTGDRTTTADSTVDTAHTTASASTSTAEATAADSSAAGAGADPERAAQLARQRAAMEATRAKRERDADPERSGLRRSVLVEAAVAVVLLAVTTVLTSTEPGRTELKEAGRGSGASPAVPDRPVDVVLPFDTGGEAGEGTLRVQLTPGRTGSNALHVWAESPARTPVDAPELKVALTNEDKQIGPLPVVPDRLAPGHWSANGVQVPLAGTWKLDVTIRTSDTDQVTVNKNVKIG